MSNPSRVLTRADILAACADTEGEKALIFFVESMKAGENPPPPVMEALQAAFTKILGGEDPRKALGLVSKQGGSQRQWEERTAKLHREIAERFVSLRESANSYDDSVAICCEEFHRGTRVVETAIADHRAQVLLWRRMLKGIDRDRERLKAAGETISNLATQIGQAPTVSLENLTALSPQVFFTDFLKSIESVTSSEMVRTAKTVANSSQAIAALGSVQRLMKRPAKQK